MNRRMTRAGAAIIGLGLVLSSVGCAHQSAGSSAAGNSKNLVSTTPAGQTPVSRVTWNLPYEPASIDPAKTQVTADAPVQANMCESLLRENPDLTLSPNLASAYEQVNPLTWTYQLRTDVKFWDGHPMTVADVLASLRRHMDPNSGSYWAIYYQNVKSITQSGPSQITVKLSRPDELFNYELATAGGAISEAKVMESDGANYGSPSDGVMCTGPFKFQSWTPGSNINLAANEDYWDASRKPKIGTLVEKFISDPATLASALTSGEIDGMYDLPNAAIPQLEKASNGTVYLGPSTASLDLIPTEKSGPLHNANVRRAMFLALDRGAIASGVYHGDALPAQSFVNPAYAYGKAVFDAYTATLAKPAVDLTEAKALVSHVADAGAPIILATSPDPSLTIVANALRSAGQSIGLNIQVETLTPTENNDLYFDQKLRDKYDAFLNVQFTMVADPLEELLFVTKSSPYNYGQYDNPEFNNLFNAALGTADPTARAHAVVKALTAVDQDLPWVPIVSMPVRTFLNNKLTGIPTSWAFMFTPWAASVGGK